MKHHDPSLVSSMDTKVHQGKPPSLEEGPMRYERINEDLYNRVERGSKCNRCMHYIKVILYIEFALFIGWSGCIFLTNYYGDHRYNNLDEPYDTAKSAQDHYDQNSLMDSDGMEDIKWERGEHEKTSMEKSETVTESLIDWKSDAMVSETTTTTTNPSARMEDKDTYGSSMLSKDLAKWNLHRNNDNWEDSAMESETTTMTTTPSARMEDKDTDGSSMLSKDLAKWNLRRNNDNWEESLRNSDDFWSSMMTSVEDKNDKTDVSSRELMTFAEDSDTESTTQYYLTTMDTKYDQPLDIDIDNLLLLPFWVDSLWTPDHTNEMTNSNNDFIEDELYGFNIEDSDIVQRILSQHARTIAERSTDSSSSEETKSPAPKIKRSTESSSSEETKNPAPKVKRSTDSSSSESDSSSSENDQTTTEATKNKINCPKILADDGSTIDDPEDIIKHIKRNWFNWLLETPVPDCDGPKSAKTVTLDECGKFVIRCTSDKNDNETSDQMKEAASRGTRSAEDIVFDRETCKRMANATRENIERLKPLVVIGEESDPEVKKLRHNFANGIRLLSVHAIIGQSIIGANQIDEKLQNSLLSLRQHIANSTDDVHRSAIEDSGPLAQETLNEIRVTIASMTSLYTECREKLADDDLQKEALRLFQLMIERERCSLRRKVMLQKEESLATEIVTGESSDATVVELRQTFQRMIETLGVSMTSADRTDPEVIPTGPVNVTDEQWREKMVALKTEIAKVPDDPDIRQRLQDSAPPTQEQTNQLREIIEYYMRQHRPCDTIAPFGLEVMLEDLSGE